MLPAARVPVLQDRFTLEAVVGTGGSCEVYRGTCRLERQAVAVKLLRPPERSERLQRFFREAAVLAELAHPAIVRYIAHGIAPAGNPFLVMEWLEGETLEARLRRGPMSPRESWRLARRLSEGLSIAHARGIAHRDIKPSNVFLVGGQVEDAKILDFGIAKRLLQDDRLTRTGGQIGTPAYMSPEQIRGESELDRRSDIFSLGATLYECLTGQAAFRAHNLLAIAAEICLSDPAWPRTLRDDIPPPLEALVLHMLEKDPARRPQDAAELARHLVEIGEPPGGDSTPIAQAALASAEQRVVAVVVIAGVELSEQTLDDAQSTPLDAPNLDQLVSVAHGFGARLERMPDGLLVACISTGGAPTDQIARAARMAAHVAELLPEARVAVSHGRALLHGHLPLGEVVERGAALVADAKPGVRLEARSAELLKGQFALESEEWGSTLLGEQHPQDAVLGRATPFVGRKLELNSLCGAFEQCCEEPTARGALITASPGMGKTRLAREFITKLRRDHAFTVFWAQGDPIRSNAPLGLLSSLLRRAAGIGSSDPLPIRQDKLRVLVQRSVDAASMQLTTEFLGELTGIHYADVDRPALEAARNDPRLMADQIRAAWLTWLRSLLQQAPVLLVLEDVHWADPASLQLIDASLRACEHQALFVLALARPEIHERYPNLWAERPLESLRLLPLTAKTAERLVLDVLAERADPPLVQRLVAQAEGNAFFLEELMRAVAMGRAERLPDTIMAIVQVRLDALGTEAARVLRAASIFGEDFSRAGVAALTAHSPQRLAEYWKLFEDRELISRTDSERYTFRHALVRETCYAALTPEDRTLGHRLAGAWLERSADTAPAVLAAHFDRGDEPPRAIHWYARAAALAVENDDFQNALTLAERGVALGATQEQLAELRLAHLQVHSFRGESELALERGWEALACAPESSALWYAIARELVSPSLYVFKMEALRGLAEKIEQSTPEPPATHARIAALGWLAGAWSQFGESAFATRLFAACADTIDSPAAPAWLRSQLYIARGTHRFGAGEIVEAAQDMELAAGFAEQAGHARLACMARVMAGEITVELGLLEKGRDLLSAALAEAIAASFGVFVGTTRVSLVLAHFLLGNLSEARWRAEEVVRVTSAARLRATGHLYLARIDCDEGQPAAAIRHAQAALEQTEGVVVVQVPARAVLARAYLDAGRPEEALALALEALAGLEKVAGAVDLEALIPLVTAEALWANARYDEAKQAIGNARERLLQRAARVSDPALRASFLALRDHARTLRRAHEWLDD